METKMNKRNIEIGNRIKKLINDYDYTEEELAKKMKISLDEVKMILDGEKEITVVQILDITKIFNLSIEQCSQIFFGQT